MTESTGANSGNRVDIYARRELTPAEARDLAQESLANPSLFAELTDVGLVTTSLAGASTAVHHANVIPFPPKSYPRRVPTWLAATAAAVLVAASLYFLRPSSLGHPTRLPQDQSQVTATASSLKPALAYSAKPGQPVLLASDLQPEPERGRSAAVFRSSEPDSRSPRPAGSIVSIEDGLATIDLGSLDGLAKGSEVQVFPDERAAQPVGTLAVTTVFRERARGRILAGGDVRARYRVRVASAIHLRALLEQVDARANRGDPDAARKMADQAASWAERMNVPPGELGKSLARLATLEYQTGDAQAAETHYQSAADRLTQAGTPLSDQSAAWNNLAVIRALRGDYKGAEAPLMQAVSTSARTGVAYARSANNLGVVAELRGDRKKAEEFYADALGALAGAANSPAQERQSVEVNLARVRDQHDER